MLFNYFKYNNSRFTYIINKLYWKIRKDKKTNRCIWCKRQHINNSYFCSNKCNRLYNKEKYQSFKHNNRCNKHKYQILTYKNICWSCYKKSFYMKKKPRTKYKIILMLYGFRMIPTFRTSKDNWNGDKIAFEQSIIDKHVKWFVYIKFYENRNKKIIPIVVGKSGSNRVNSNGSDLNFSTLFEHGKSRQFMFYNKFNWHYDHIMIKKCKNESHAYSIESKIMNNFDLFGS